MFINYYDKLKTRARELRNKSTLSEVLLWRQIRAKKLGYNFYRQKPLGNYIVDFYCPALKLVVEIDGSSHNEKQEYDRFRDEFLRTTGLQTIHFLDGDIKDNLDGVINLLKEKISLCKREGTALRWGILIFRKSSGSWTHHLLFQRRIPELATNQSPFEKGGVSANGGDRGF